MDNNQQDYDSNAAQDAGYAAGRVEEGYDRAGNDVRRDEQDVENLPGEAGRSVEQGFDNTVSGAERIPSDIGGGIEGAAKWIGDKVGGVQREGRDAENDVTGAGREVEGEGRKVEGDVDQYGQSVDNSYDQGEQQGRQG